jgi:hypothetical protein
VPDINRRGLMSVAGISSPAAELAPRAAAVPPETGQRGLATLTADSLAADAIIDRLGLAGRVQVRHLGTSRDGRPIPLLSVGEGQKSALIVGAPHPNEPTGCLTVLAMLARLGREPNFQQTPGWQWHFIPAIDIDGIALNEGWFSDDPDMLRLATLTGDGAAKSAARAVLDIRLNAFHSTTHLSAIPAAVTTDLQIAAVLATAARLGAEG